MFRRRKPTTAAAPPPTGDWRSFDSVADDYERVMGPIHAPVARDLVAAMDIPPGARVLDVGTGTGVAAGAAAELVGPGGLVVGIDPSPGMLRHARPRRIPVAAAEAIDPPFRDAAFDAVLATFVIAFFRKYDTALFDMLRVLRPGGHLGITAWTGGDDEFVRTWTGLAEAFATKELFRSAMAKAAPWFDHFADPTRLQEALRDAGLRGTRVERRTYRTTMTIDDYLTVRETSARGRFLRQALGEALWARFRERVTEEFRSRFRDPIGDSSDALIAVGRKP